VGESTLDFFNGDMNCLDFFPGLAQMSIDFDVAKAKKVPGPRYPGLTL